MNSNEFIEICDELDIVANELRNIIKDNYIDAALDLINNSEMGMGVENILSEIEENEITLSKKSYNTLMRAVKYCKTDESYYENIKYEKE